MSIPERLYRISKAYLEQVRDRIDTGLSDAERELDSDNPAGDRRNGRGSGIDSDIPLGTDPEAMMRRAEARIAAARRDLDSRNELAAARAAAEASSGVPVAAAADSAASVPSAPAAFGTAPRAAVSAPVKRTAEDIRAEADPNYHDYKLLGVPVGGDLAQVQAAYEKLCARCDPRRYEGNSPEQKQAEQILQRINAAFESLRRRLDPTENRFGKLEIE